MELDSNPTLVMMFPSGVSGLVVNTRINSVVVPAATVPRRSVMKPNPVSTRPGVESAASKVVPPGMMSVNSTFCALLGPVLVTSTV